VLARAAEHGLILVIDECDHTRESLMMVVHAVLNAGPKSRVLVASRDPLNLPDEHVHRLGSLSVPRDDAPATEATLASHDATLLFVARAQASWPDFDLSERSCRDVIRIARRLGGVPMAIELAAARARLLGTERLLHTLEESLRPVAQETGGVLTRQAVVRVAVDWSISILSPREQLRLRQLASLVGGFTLDDARQACGDSSHSASATAAAGRDAVASLESLCEKHLVMLGINDRGDECYSMHALVREAALRRGAR
jgi:predicted ATPase